MNVTSASTIRARRWLTLGIPLMVIIGGYLPFLLFKAELPDPVASHFDASGQADASMSVRHFVLVNTLMILSGLAICLWLGLRRRTLPEGTGAVAGFTGGLIAATGAGILLSTALTQRNLDHWMDAPSVYGSIFGVVVAGFAIGALGAWCGARSPGSNPAKKREVPAMALAGSEQAVWSATIRSTPTHIAGMVTLVIGLASLWLLPPIAGLVIVTSACAIIALATVRLRIDRQGLLVNYGNLPWPTTQIDLKEIATASVIDVQPMHWGGWGYRGNLTLANQAAVVMRAGPGLRIELVDGKVFVVTVDNPDQGVALLNAQLARRN